jgi:uncharacterized caspase-like protein
MMKKWIKCIYFLFFLFCFQKIALSSDRIAVVIGVNQYLNLTGLSASVNDAKMMKSYLERQKYKVYYLDDYQKDLNRRPSNAALKKIMTNIENITYDSKPDKMIFYFSGHGVSIKGRNYIALPNADIEKKYGLVNLDSKIIPWLRRIQARQTLVFIDACRENISPTRSAKIKGIKVTKRKKVKPEGIFIVYAASPGGYSLEKKDATNGYFTENLIKGFRVNNHKALIDLAKWLRNEVPRITEKETGYAQVPFIGGDYDPAAVFTISEQKQKLPPKRIVQNPIFDKRSIPRYKSDVSGLFLDIVLGTNLIQIDWTRIFEEQRVNPVDPSFEDIFEITQHTNDMEFNPGINVSLRLTIMPSRGKYRRRFLGSFMLMTSITYINNISKSQTITQKNNEDLWHGTPNTTAKSSTFDKKIDRKAAYYGLNMYNFDFGIFYKIFVTDSSFFYTGPSIGLLYGNWMEKNSYTGSGVLFRLILGLRIAINKDWGWIFEANYAPHGIGNSFKYDDDDKNEIQDPSTIETGGFYFLTGVSKSL